VNVSKRECSEIFISLLLSWVVYILAQGDILIPGIALFFILPAYVLTVVKNEFKGRHFTFSLRAVISVSILSGGIWRSFAPLPSEAVSIVPILLPALQSASIIMSLFVWFMDDLKWRRHYLVFLPWFTVATSINVPFHSLLHMAFWLFCFINVGIIVLRVYFPYSDKTKAEMRKSKHKNLKIYFYPILLFFISFLMFIFLVKGVKVGDDVFIHLISHYIGKRHFRFFDSQLILSGVANNRDDVRPIMEIDKISNNRMYLLGQIFDDYQQGVWTAPVGLPMQEISSHLSRSKEMQRLVMFEYLEDVIPAPRGLSAIESRNTRYKKDSNGLIFNVEKKIPKATFQLEEGIKILEINERLIKKYLKVSPFLEGKLEPVLDHVTANLTDPYDSAKAIEKYFKENYQYSLYLNFRADERGLVYMIYKNRPAYCSYFSSAMIMMLRVRGIPARMATGFLASETIGRKKDKYIVRGRDAHAWVEALLPVINPEGNMPVKTDSGKYLARWIRFDPTPAASRQEVLSGYEDLNKIADWIFCTQKRMKAFILDLEPKILVRILFVLIIVLIVEEGLKKMISKYIKTKKTKDSLKIGKVHRIFPEKEFYDRLEAFVKMHLRVERNPSETDEQLIKRLVGQERISEEVIKRIFLFLKQYHALRFGKKDVHNLKDLLNKIVE